MANGVPEYDTGLVGQRIRVIRSAFNLSQGKLAARLGISPSTVGNWEQGLSRPSFEQAKRIADEFDVTLDYIFLGRTFTLRHGVAERLVEASRNALA